VKSRPAGGERGVKVVMLQGRTGPYKVEEVAMSEWFGMACQNLSAKS
jgi:hypothetical protein